MRRVVPWPATGEPGYINFHWLRSGIKDPNARVWSGTPFTDPAALINRGQFLLGKPNVFDMYYCLSRQSKTKIGYQGKVQADRSAANALCLKALWLDVDVKPPPKGYATLVEALDAVQGFITAFKLPPASALVGSGGGVHVYWISARPLTPDEWQPYANGLKAAALQHGLLCDAGVTVDRARVLRVPDTLNYKTTPPQRTKLLGMLPETHDYDFATSHQMLLGLAPPSAAANTADSGLFDPALFPKQALNGPKDSLADGIEPGKVGLLDWAPLMDQCAFFKTALATGGKEYTQPMWNLTTLMATFLEDGNGLAHRMGKKHPGYSPESTEALWERKGRERQDRGLGWPSCGAIQTAGCSACALCPHLPKGKSPLNFTAPKAPPVTAAVTSAIVLGDTPTPEEMFLPEGYMLDDGGYIYAMVKRPGGKDQPPRDELYKLFHSKLSAPWAQRAPDALNFKTDLDRGREPQQVSIPHVSLVTGGTDMWVQLGQQGVKPVTEHKRMVEGFLMNWIAKIHHAQASMTSVPFGWLMDDVEKGKRVGFVYGGKVFHSDGRVTPSGFGDNNTRDLYKPTGKSDPWFAACKLLTDQHRPEIEVITAASFAAPLLMITAQNSVLLAPWSSESGANKSTAVDLANAVWSHPKLTKEVTMSTAKSVIERMGMLKNLPLYWDEIKDKKDQDAVFDAAFTATLGVSGGRLTSQIKQRDRGSWQTILIIASNLSFTDYLVRRQKTTDAGLNRVLEFEVKKPAANAPGQINSMTAQRIYQELHYNYGCVGEEYSKMLALHHAEIEQFVLAVVARMEARISSVIKDRFWVAALGCLMAGAELANRLGATFNLQEIEDFLVFTFEENVKRRFEAGVTPGSTDFTEDALTQFLKAYTQNTLWTNESNMGPGKPKAISVVNGPKLDAGKSIHVQWVLGERLLRISRKEFENWLALHDIAPRPVLSGIRDFLKGNTNVRARLANGTPYNAGGKEKLIHIPVPVGSDLESMMYLHSVPDAGASPSKTPDVDPSSALTAAMAQASKDLKTVRGAT